MTTQWLTRNFIGIGIVSTVMCIGYLSENFSDPKFFTVGSALFITWLMLPYLVWAFINEFRPDTFPKHPRVYIGFAIAMPIIGASVVGYTFLFPDAQNAFFIFYIPLIQFVCLGVAWEVCKK